MLGEVGTSLCESVGAQNRKVAKFTTPSDALVQHREPRDAWKLGRRSGLKAKAANNGTMLGLVVDSREAGRIQHGFCTGHHARKPNSLTLEAMDVNPTGRPGRSLAPARRVPKCGGLTLGCCCWGGASARSISHRASGRFGCSFACPTTSHVRHSPADSEGSHCRALVWHEAVADEAHRGGPVRELGVLLRVEPADPADEVHTRLGPPNREIKKSWR